MSKKQTGWLMAQEEIAAERQQFIDDYFTSGEIFQTPYGSGYWLYGVEQNEIGWWLAFEHDEAEFDSSDTEQHRDAILAWIKGLPLPPHYFCLSTAVACDVFENIVRKYGESGIDDIDLPTVDEALQWTILKEIKYG